MNKPQYVALSFEAAIPRGIERIPVGQIIRMRADLSGELANFRDHVQAQSDQLKGIAAIDDQRMQEEQLRVLVQETAEGPLRDLERDMKIFGEVGRSLWDLQTLTPPGFAYAITNHAHSPLVTAGTAVAAGTFSATWTARRRRRGLLRNSPVGYLLQIKRRTRPAGALRALAATSLGRHQGA